MTNETDTATLQKLQVIEQALHAQTAQRATHQSQLNETENALRELATTTESYRIIGNIMIKTDTAALRKELEEKQSTLQTRIMTVERQEVKLREEMQKLQNSILKGA
jgi:prefoldin beta subunit